MLPSCRDKAGRKAKPPENGSHAIAPSMMAIGIYYPPKTHSRRMLSSELRLGCRTNGSCRNAANKEFAVSTKLKKRKHKA